MSVMDTVKGWFSRAKEQGTSMAGDAMDKGRDMAGDAMDKGQDMADKAMNEVKERVGGGADDASPDAPA